jgi:hypothetical protein
MNLPLWYAALFAIATGVVIAAFWVVALATGASKRLLAQRTDAGAHVAAELVTAALLVAGGAATIARPDAISSAVLYGLGGGALAYALVEAPAHYVHVGLRPVAYAAWSAWPFAIAAFVARFAS